MNESANKRMNAGSIKRIDAFAIKRMGARANKRMGAGANASTCEEVHVMNGARGSVVIGKCGATWCAGLDAPCDEGFAFWRDLSHTRKCWIDFYRLCEWDGATEYDVTDNGL